MRPLSIAGAAIGGLIGAGIWFALAYFANIQVGYVAIGVGFLAGAGAKLLGGKGGFDGVLAAGVAVTAIVLGSYTAVSVVAEEEIEKVVNDVSDRELQETYDALTYDAVAFNEFVMDDDEMQLFAERYEYDYDGSRGFSVAELADFKEHAVPLLKKMGKDGKGMSFNDYKAHVVAKRREAIGEFVEKAPSPYTEQLNGIDFLFWGIGAFVAFGVVNKEEEDVTGEYDPDLAPGVGGFVPPPRPQMPQAQGGMPQQQGQMPQAGMPQQRMPNPQMPQQRRPMPPQQARPQQRPQQRAPQQRPPQQPPQA